MSAFGHIALATAALTSGGVFLPESCCQAARKCVSLQIRLLCFLPVLHEACVCERCRLPSQQRSQHRGALRLAAAINKGLRQTRLALHGAGLCHRVCLVIAVLISLAAPELTGRGLEESERVKRENATCLQY